MTPHKLKPFGLQLYRHISTSITGRQVQKVAEPCNKHDDKSVAADVNVVFAWQSGHPKSSVTALSNSQVGQRVFGRVATSYLVGIQTDFVQMKEAMNLSTKAYELVAVIAAIIVLDKALLRT
jgi:hypothetical protein